jgi:hypothetical protein
MVMKLEETEQTGNLFRIWVAEASGGADPQQTEGSFSISGGVLGNFQVIYSFWPHSVASGSNQPLNKNGWNFPGDNLSAANNSDVLALPKVEVRMEAQDSIIHMSHHDWEIFTLPEWLLTSIEGLWYMTLDNLSKSSDLYT